MVLSARTARAAKRTLASFCERKEATQNEWPLLFDKLYFRIFSRVYVPSCLSDHEGRISLPYGLSHVY